MRAKDFILITVITVCGVFVGCFVAVDIAHIRNRSYAVLPATPAIAEPNLSDALDCVVHIRAGNAEGSGFLVSSTGIVMTARHVLSHADANGVIVTLRNGLSYTSTAMYIPPTTGVLAGPDVGFLKVEYYHPTRYFGVQPARPALGSDVWCLGHPYGRGVCPWTVSRGIVSATDRDCKGAFGAGTSIQIDAPSYAGNSGGPVIDRSGRVVGILVGSWSGEECLSICVPIGDAAPWLTVFRVMLETRP
jgi:S1-C subfamily serine protease